MSKKWITFIVQRIPIAETVRDQLINRFFAPVFGRWVVFRTIANCSAVIQVRLRSIGIAVHIPKIILRSPRSCQNQRATQIQQYQLQLEFHISIYWKL